MPYTLADLTHGDHVLHIYNTPSEYLSILVGYIQQGLMRHEKVVYAAGAIAPETILKALEAACCDPRPYVERGQLIILPAESVYLPDGTFQAERMLQLVRDAIESAHAEGYTAARLGGEMSWVLQHRPGTEQLLDYEAQLNQRLPRKAYLLLCQYQRQRFPADVLAEMLRTHPVVIVGEHVTRNGYYVPGAARHLHLGAGRLRSWLASLSESGPIPEPNASYPVHLAARPLQMHQRARRVTARVFQTPQEESNPQWYL